MEEKVGPDFLLIFFLSFSSKPLKTCWVGGRGWVRGGWRAGVHVVGWGAGRDVGVPGLVSSRGTGAWEARLPPQPLPLPPRHTHTHSSQVLLVLQAIRAKEEQLSNQRHVLETLTGLEDQVGGWPGWVLNGWG